jgi:predicted RNA-binding Zn ribbon-like protein
MSTSVPGQRGPAPGSLAVVQEFCNTTWLRTGEETFTDPAALASWLAARRLSDRGRSRVSDRDLALALDVRSALREAIVGRPASFDGLSVQPHVGPDSRPGWLPMGAGVPAALCRIVIAAWDAERDSRWQRLKLCAAADCRWAFYDPSRNHSATWCNMSVCGARAKSRTYYQRHRPS